MSKKLLIALLGVGLVFLAGPGIAQADHDLRFGIRPTKAFEDRPETFSYFSYEISPGDVLSDEALVINSGDVAAVIELYAADGITAVNGGTAFAKQDQEPTGVKHWLSLAMTEIVLGPGEEMVVPFTVTVPPDASPGQHVAGLVVAAPSGGAVPSGEEGSGQFSAIVVQQVGVAVVIDVPGPHAAGLEITGACLKEQDDLGAVFVVAVRNTGNVFVRGEGSLMVMDRDGLELASNPLKMGTVLAGDATVFQVRHPVHLNDGDYLVNAVLNYSGRSIIFDRQQEQAPPPASIAGVEVKIKDGQPEEGCEREARELALPPASITDIGAAAGEGGGPPIRLIGIVSALLLAGFILILAAWARKRRGGDNGRAAPVPPAPPAPPVPPARSSPFESSRSAWTPTMRPVGIVTPPNDIH